ncbi:hypothetical protein QVD17_04780 [Tagetes erecta]|uniref:Uncharacterized protein n=1 Tax=Tagetes erecta TaxID=13708 RepID=A0AAD8LCK0_TARER|nr:hypothetical protein QVD17_04780 [Tagetes erecta]
MSAGMPTNSKGQAWFCSTGLPSDIVVEVDDMSFHLHKFPLMAKSRKLHELITEQEANFTRNAIDDRRTSEIQDESEMATMEDERCCHVSFMDFPGGAKTFEMAAKFCYTMKIELSSSNVASLRCAGEALEMTEEYCEDNLISKTEKFLSQTVLQSLRDSIETLKSCEHLMPVAEDIGIIERCIHSISTKVSAMDPSMFSWPVNEATPRRITDTAGGDLWIDELTLLIPPLFKHLINAMKLGQNLNQEIIENFLLRYAKKHISGINRTTRKPQSTYKPSEIDQKELLETIVTNLPEQTYSRSTITVKIFFGMLRTANILNASDNCKSTLEKKIGSQFEQATLDDLLMPSYSYLSDTLYDVDCVQRILAQFLHSVDDRSTDLTLVGKLIDGYLSEIALDANLTPAKFYELAVALPEHARVYDDGLYRSVDVYIKAHQWITEADREKVSGVLDCRKLTLEACTHAAQNERLPLRAVVQVLFFEQLQLRQAIAGTLMATDMRSSESERSPVTRQEVVEHDEKVGEGDDVTWRAAVRENQVLRLGMDSMRTRVHELERECTTMKKAIEKMDKVSWRGSLTKKFGCTFKTQVCDSHEPTTAVETRKGRTHRTHRQST